MTYKKTGIKRYHLNLFMISFIDPKKIRGKIYCLWSQYILSPQLSGLVPIPPHMKVSNEPTSEGWKAELTVADLFGTSMHGIYVGTHPQLAGENPTLGPNSLNTLGEGQRLVPLKTEFLFTHCTAPEGWKAECRL